LKAFVAQIGGGLTLGQVLIRPSGGGCELRHAEDCAAATEALRVVKYNETRALAQTTEEGQFRPLKAAPTLRRGWRIMAADDSQLDAALNQLYPGAIADWYAAQSPTPPVTSYRDFTHRQSGMYRITTMLSDAEAAEVIRAVCAPARCLKRRLWSVTGLEPDAPPQKSLIPCLEPCAVLLESARQAVRAAQQEKS